MSMAPLVSPPSLTPSIHPPKRCKMARDKPNLQNGFLCPPAGVVSLPNSPCSESSTLQRTLVMKQAGTITGDGLAKRLQKGSKHGRNFLLLDCRPFIAYNVSHIKGAINVNCCDRFNRKRLQQGKASLADLATTKEGKEMLKKRNWKEVVVYDDSSEDLSSLPFSHTLFLVINSLVEDLRQPIMLIGGLRCFQVSFLSLRKSFSCNVAPAHICYINTNIFTDYTVIAVRRPPHARPNWRLFNPTWTPSASITNRYSANEGYRKPSCIAGHSIPVPRKHERCQ